MNLNSHSGLCWRTWLSWLGGFAFSCLFIWGVAAIFTDSAIPVEKDSFFGRYVRKSGVKIRKRSEGWATTRIGRHGLIADGAEVLATPGNKFIFWGDSHGEGVQVDDNEKTMSVFNSLREKGGLRGVTSAASGLSVPDYYYDLAKFSEEFPGVVGHVIMLNGIADVLPGFHLECHSRFLMSPWRMEKSYCSPNSRGLFWGPWIYTLRIEFLYNIFKSLKSRDFQFGLTRDQSVPRPPLPRPSLRNMSIGWNFLLQALKQKTDGFLVFIYCPMVPVLGKGGINRFDADALYKEAFASACARNGVGFVDLTQDFTNFYDQKKEFPRGFFNTIPGEGHLNRYGHALVAKGLNRYFKQVGK